MDAATNPQLVNPKLVVSSGKENPAQSNLRSAPFSVGF